MVSTHVIVRTIAGFDQNKGNSREVEYIRKKQVHWELPWGCPKNTFLDSPRQFKSRALGRLIDRPAYLPKGGVRGKECGDKPTFHTPHPRKMERTAEIL
jgi:hypothetical protein